MINDNFFSLLNIHLVASITSEKAAIFKSQFSGISICECECTGVCVLQSFNDSLSFHLFLPTTVFPQNRWKDTVRENFALPLSFFHFLHFIFYDAWERTRFQSFQHQYSLLLLVERRKMNTDYNENKCHENNSICE